MTKRECNGFEVSVGETIAGLFSFCFRGFLGCDGSEAAAVRMQGPALYTFFAI
jgi:hypothetical protein